jgi:hypothetical protein
MLDLNDHSKKRKRCIITPLPFFNINSPNAKASSCSILADIKIVE